MIYWSVRHSNVKHSVHNRVLSPCWKQTVKKMTLTTLQTDLLIKVESTFPCFNPKLLHLDWDLETYLSTDKTCHYNCLRNSWPTPKTFPGRQYIANMRSVCEVVRVIRTPKKQLGAVMCWRLWHCRLSQWVLSPPCMDVCMLACRCVYAYAFNIHSISISLSICKCVYVYMRESVRTIIFCLSVYLVCPCCSHIAT